MTDQEEVQYETLKSEEIRYGARENKFIEISRKRAPDSTEFFMISKGFYNREDEKRYQKGVGFPYDPAIVKFISEKLNTFVEGAPEVQEAPEAPAEVPAEVPSEEAEAPAEEKAEEAPTEVPAEVPSEEAEAPAEEKADEAPTEVPAEEKAEEAPAEVPKEKPNKGKSK